MKEPAAANGVSINGKLYLTAAGDEVSDLILRHKTAITGLVLIKSNKLDPKLFLFLNILSRSSLNTERI